MTLSPRCLILVLALCACDSNRVDPPRIDDAGVDVVVDSDVVPPDADVRPDATLPDANPPLMVEDWALGITTDGAATGIAIAADPRGGVTVVGHFAGGLTFGGETLASQGADDVFVASIDVAGRVRWVHAFGGPRAETVGGVAADDEGNVFVVGRFTESMVVDGRAPLVAADQSDIFLVSFSPTGELRLALSYGGPYSEGARAVAAGGGSVCFTGDFQGQLPLGATTLSGRWQLDAFVACVDGRDGALRWASAYLSDGNDVGTAIAVDAEGFVWVALSFDARMMLSDGTELEPAGGFDGALVAHDALGEMRFAVPVGGTGADEIKSVAVDADGNAYLTGVFSDEVSFGDEVLEARDRQDIFVASLDATGAPRWASGYGGAGHDQAIGIALSGSDVVVTGRFDGTLNVLGGELGSPNEMDAVGEFDVFVARLDSTGVALESWALGSDANDQGNGVAGDGAGGAYLTGYVGGTASFADVTFGTTREPVQAFVLHRAASMSHLE